MRDLCKLEIIVFGMVFFGTSERISWIEKERTMMGKNNSERADITNYNFGIDAISERERTMMGKSFLEFEKMEGVSI
jgi:hypothetical protein